MTRRYSIGILFPVLGLAFALASAPGAWAGMQTKTTAPTPINKSTAPKAAAMKPLDINTASEEEFAAVGIDKATAKKIIESRPFRNKTELVSRSLLTRDQYEKLKEDIVAKQPAKPAK